MTVGHGQTHREEPSDDRPRRRGGTQAAGGRPRLETESYAAMEYRHGPISISDRSSPVWSFGEPPAGLEDEVATTGALFTADALDPFASLVRAQRPAVEVAAHRGMSPDRPRNLSRSVFLTGAAA